MLYEKFTKIHLLRKKTERLNIIHKCSAVVESRLTNICSRSRPSGHLLQFKRIWLRCWTMQSARYFNNICIVKSVKYDA